MYEGIAMIPHATAWRLERTLWKLPVWRPKNEVVEEVMRLIRTSFIPKEDIAATIEKLRIPGVECGLDSEAPAFAYNKALDTVMASLIEDEPTAPAR
jgi:hypothetical protein